MTQKKALYTILILLAVGVILGVMMILGVKVRQDNTSIKISGGIFYSVKVPYSDIKEIKLEDSITFGSRTNGAAIGSYKFGNYENSTYDGYKLFVNTEIHKYIVITYGHGCTVVFNCKNEKTTVEKYENLLTLMK